MSHDDIHDRPLPAAAGPSTDLQDGHGFTRRQVALGSAAMAAGATLWGIPWPGAVQAAVEAQTSATAVPADAVARFHVFSKAITGHGELDAVTAGRMYGAFAGLDAGFAAQAEALAGLARPGMAADALLAAAEQAGLRDAALAIVTAWYTGTVGQGEKAVPVTYADALMYRTVADGMTAPTYCNYGPLWWTGQPPAANVEPPRPAARHQVPPPPVSRSH